jgi:hypothetical protein
VLSDLWQSRRTISGKSLCGMNAEAFAKHNRLASTSGDGRRREPPQQHRLQFGLERTPALEFSIAQLRDEAVQPVAVA